MRGASETDNALFFATQLDAIYKRLAASNQLSLSDVQRIRWAQIEHKLGPDNAVVQAAGQVSPLDDTGKALQAFITLQEAERTHDEKETVQLVTRLKQEANFEMHRNRDTERQLLTVSSKAEAQRAESARLLEAARVEIEKLKLHIATLPVTAEQKRILEQHVRRLEEATNQLISDVDNRFKSMRPIFRTISDMLYDPQRGVPSTTADAIMAQLNVDALRKCFAPIFQNYLNTSGSSVNLRGLADNNTN